VTTQAIDRAAVATLILDSLQFVLAQFGSGSDGPVTEAAALIGNDSVLDSIGLVALVVEVEQRLFQEHNLSLALANERAMSQRRSPFRTVATLTDYVCLLIEEERGR
jgi:acyl carrier protein